jgi:hypothetical protein
MESKLEITFHSKALIKGVKFRARGWKCRETSYVKVKEQAYGSIIKTFIPRDKKNNLKNTWHVKKYRSSWCKFKMVTKRKEKINMGQIIVF